MVADQIERGDLGDVGCLGIVVMGDETYIYGAGIDSSAPSVGLLLHAGFLQMSQAVANHGK